MYFRVNLKMKKPTLCCCFTWIVFIEFNFTVAFLLIRKTWEDDLLIIWGMVDFKKWLYEVSSHGVEVGLELYQFHNFIFTCDYVRHS